MWMFFYYFSGILFYLYLFSRYWISTIEVGTNQIWLTICIIFFECKRKYLLISEIFFAPSSSSLCLRRFNHSSYFSSRILFVPANDVLFIYWSNILIDDFNIFYRYFIPFILWCLLLLFMYFTCHFNREKSKQLINNIFYFAYFFFVLA